MQRRPFIVLIGGPHVITSGAPATADASDPQLASYYDRHMALLDGVAYGWTGRGVPVRMRAGSRQVGVSQDAYFALHDDGRLISWGDAPGTASLLMSRFGASASGQYGDGRLTATAEFVNTAGDAVAVKAHSGNALCLSRGGMAMGTGGDRYGPLGCTAWATRPGLAACGCCEGPALQQLLVGIQIGRQCSRRLPCHESSPRA